MDRTALRRCARRRIWRKGGPRQKKKVVYFGWPVESLERIDLEFAKRVKQVVDTEGTTSLNARLEGLSSGQDLFLHERIYCCAVAHLAEKGKYEEALALARSSSTPLEEHLAHITFHMGQNGNVDGVLSVAAEARQCGALTHPRFYEIIVRSLLRHEHLKEGMQFFEEMKKINVPIGKSLLRMVGVMLCKFGDLKEADVFLPDSTDKLNVFMRQMLRDKRPDVAIGMYRDYMRTHPRATLSRFTLNLLLKALGMSGDVERMLSFFEQMSDLRDRRSYDSMIHALAQRERIDDALQMVHQMKMAGFEPSEWTYAKLFVGLCKVDFIKARTLLDDLLGAGIQVSVDTYTVFLGECARKGLRSQAEEIFKLMKKHAVRPQLMSYACLLDAYGRHGDTAGAQRVIRRLEQDGYEMTPVLCNILINLYGKAGRTSMALRIIDHMKFKGLNLTSKTYSVLLMVLIRSGEITEAENRFAEMLGREIFPTEQAGNALLDCFLVRGNLRSARVLMELMHRLHYNISEKQRRRFTSLVEDVDDTNRPT
mmetsp:Transcript_8043/g.24231  ORF Transcript_8043/g.24231 Transcript_8043/m.24231 type:complete len:538 (+) Transcript_8043:214-1827(+)